MKEGNYREYGGSSSCYFHPKEVVIGVCHLCLNERLLIIAAKQGVNNNKKKKFKSSKLGYYYSNKSSSNNSSFNNNNIDKPKSYVNNLPKLFGIASFFNSKDKFRRHNRRRRRRCESNHEFFDAADHHDNNDADTASTSLEEDESFISIKFGDNGVASWDKTSSNVSLEQQCSSLSWGGQTLVKDKGSDSNYSLKSVVEHAKPRPPSLRWRERIGQLLQVIRWKKSSKANASGVGGGGGGNNKVVRNNKSWIRTSKIKTKE